VAYPRLVIPTLFLRREDPLLRSSSVNAGSPPVSSFRSRIEALAAMPPFFRRSIIIYGCCILDIQYLFSCVAYVVFYPGSTPARAVVQALFSDASRVIKTILFFLFHYVASVSRHLVLFFFFAFPNAPYACFLLHERLQLS